MINETEDLLTKCDQLLSISNKFRREMEVFYSDKQKIQNEYEIFSTNPPKTLKRDQIEAVLRNLQKLKIKRNILNSREQSFFDDLQSLRQLKTAYITLATEKKMDERTIKNSELNLRDKTELLLSELEFINSERNLIAKEFHRLSSVPQPFGLEGIKLDNLPPLDIKDSLDKLIEFRDENRDKFKKNNPRLLREIDNVILYLQDGSLGKKYDLDRTVNDIVREKISDDKKRKKALEKKRRKQLGLDDKDKSRKVDLNGEYDGDFDRFYDESEAMQAFFNNHDDFLMNDMVEIATRIKNNANTIRKYETNVYVDRNLNNRERINRKLLELEREKVEMKIMKNEVFEEENDRNLRRRRLDAIEDMKSMLRKQRDTLLTIFEMNQRANLMTMAPIKVTRKTLNLILKAKMMIMNPKREDTENQKIRKSKGKAKKGKMKITSKMRKTGEMSSARITKEKLNKIKNIERKYTKKRLNSAILSGYKKKNDTLIHSENNSFMLENQLNSPNQSFNYEGKEDKDKKVT